MASEQSDARLGRKNGIHESKSSSISLTTTIDEVVSTVTVDLIMSSGKDSVCAIVVSTDTTIRVRRINNARMKSKDWMNPPPGTLLSVNGTKSKRLQRTGQA